MTGVAPKIRYILVGTACAVLYNVVMIVGDRLHFHYTLSYVAAFILVVPFGFALHVLFTFRVQPSVASFVRYTVAMATNAPIALALFFAFCDVNGMPVAVASPLVTVMLVVWNYLAGRWALVRPASGADRAPAPRA